MSLPSYTSIDEQFVSDYVKMCRENDERFKSLDIVEAWLDNQDAPANVDDETMQSLVAQVNYYIN